MQLTGIRGQFSLPDIFMFFQPVFQHFMAHQYQGPANIPEPSLVSGKDISDRPNNPFQWTVSNVGTIAKTISERCCTDIVHISVN